MSQHTKGPWRLLPEGHGHYTPGCGEYPHIENYDGEPVIDGAWYGSVCNDADLSLIAAAPDLLEAAQAVCEAWGKFIDSFDYVPGIGDMAEDIEFQEMMRLRIAINKATINQ